MSQVTYENTTYLNCDLDNLVESGVPIELLQEHEKQNILNVRKHAFMKISDPLFMEAIRKEAEGDIAGAETARAQALQAVADIKAKYPLPEVDA